MKYKKWKVIQSVSDLKYKKWEVIQSVNDLKYKKLEVIQSVNDPKCSIMADSRISRRPSVLLFLCIFLCFCHFVCLFSSSFHFVFTIVTKSSQPHQNLHRPLKIFACVGVWTIWF